LERWLAGEPIHSRSSTSWEKSIKWAKRRPAVAALLTVSTVGALSLLILAAFLWRNAESRAQAVQDLAAAEDELRAAEEERRIVGEQVESKRAEVVSLEKKAQEAKESARHITYAADMQLAHAAWETDNVPRLLALLEKHRPQHGEDDLRGFEWDYLWRLCHADLNTLGEPVGANEAKVQGVDLMALSHDGKVLASLGSDYKIHLVNLASSGHERVIAAPQGEIGEPPAPIFSLSFAPDDKNLILVRGKTHLDLTNPPKFQDIFTGKAKLSLPLITESLELVKVEVDHPQSFSAGKFDPALGGRLKFIEPKPLLLKDRYFGALNLVVSPNHKTLALGGYILTEQPGPDIKSSQPAGILLWDLATNQEKLIQVEQEEMVTLLAWAPDGKTLASGGANKAIRLWDVDQGKLRTTLKGHLGMVTSLAYAPDGSSLATASGDGIIKLWDLKTSQLQTTLKGHLKEVTGLAFSPDSKRLISLGTDAVVKIWDPAAREGPIPVQIFEKSVTTLVFSEDGKTLSGLDLDGNLKTLDSTTGKELRKVTIQKPAPVNEFMPPFANSFFCAALSPDRKALAFAQILGDSVRLYDVVKATEMKTFRIEKAQRIRGISFSPDNKTLGAAYELVAPPGMEAHPGKVQWKWWNIPTGEEVSSPKGAYEGVQCLAFSPDGKRLASAKEDTVTVRELGTGKEILTVHCYSHQPAAMAFSPDGKRLVTGGGDVGGAGIKLWDLASGQEVLSLADSSDIISALAFSPDGKRLAAAIGNVEFSLFDLMHHPPQVKIWDTTPVNEQSK
jgi:WD40 repeat protein